MTYNDLSDVLSNALNTLAEEDGYFEETCPECGGPLGEHPALSRTDNKTDICSDCGTRQALESYFNAKEEEI